MAAGAPRPYRAELRLQEQTMTEADKLKKQVEARKKWARAKVPRSGGGSRKSKHFRTGDSDSLEGLSDMIGFDTNSHNTVDCHHQMRLVKIAEAQSN